MGDPMVTGLHTTGFLVNKGFDHIPAAVFAGDTYRKFLPKALRPRKEETYVQTNPQDEARHEPSRHRHRSASGDGLSSHSGGARRTDHRDSMDDAAHYNTGGYGAQYPSQYSADPPRLRPEYVPRGAGKYYPSHPPDGSAYGGSEQSSRRVRDDQDAYYNRSVARRPAGAVRRTSSFNGREQPKQQSAKEAAEEKIEHHLRQDFLTKSPEGLAVGGLGAIVGGFLAEKAQLKAGREERSSGSVFLTGLGAVVGGLAANAAVDHYQHKKGQYARQDARWDKKFGEPEDKHDRARREHRESSGRSGRHGDHDDSRAPRSSDDYGVGDDQDTYVGRARSDGSRRRKSHYYDDEVSSLDRGGGRSARSEYDADTRMSGARASQAYHGEREGRGYAPYPDDHER